VLAHLRTKRPSSPATNLRSRPFSRRFVRAVAKTAEGQGVAAIVVRRARTRTRCSSASSKRCVPRSEPRS
jgi:hypothetical protein